MPFKSIVAMLIALLFAPPLAAKAPKTSAVPPAPTLLADPVLDPENTWLLDLSDGGRVTIQLRPDVAPQHVARIKSLTRQGFYDGLVFHRVIDGFMAQGGDPKGTGEGGSPLPNLKAEFNALPHLRGTVSMARADDPDSANSQFFIMFAPKFSLDHKYTAFGRVTDGMPYVDAIERGEPPANPTRIVHASIAADAGRSPEEVRALTTPPVPNPAPEATIPATAAAAAPVGPLPAAVTAPPAEVTNAAPAVAAPTSTSTETVPPAATTAEPAAPPATPASPAEPSAPPPAPPEISAPAPVQPAPAQ
jgi:peptidylprolyl isomerase